MNLGKLKEFLKRSTVFKGDPIIWIVFMVLGFTSLLIVFSSTGALAFRKTGGQVYYYIIRQFGVQILGLGVIWFMVNVIPVKLYNRFANIGYCIALVFVIMGLSAKLHGGATGRTLSLGIISFQPAEMAKIALVIWSARLLAICQNDPIEMKRTFYRILAGSGLLCGAIALADFSTALLIFMSVVIMMFVARIPMRLLFGLAGAGVLVLAALIAIAPYLPDGGKVGRIKTVRGRVERFINGDENSKKGLTQADYAQVAIHRGGIIGEGAGDSLVSNFMSAAYNDFIFAIIIEEYGLLGAGLVIFAYLVLLSRGGIIVRACSRTFPAFLASGIVAIITLQAMINMGVSVGLLPVTGQPLPWVSWGGTSQVFTAIAFGLLFSISSQNDKKRREEVEQKFNSEQEFIDEDVQLKEEPA